MTGNEEGRPLMTGGSSKLADEAKIKTTRDGRPVRPRPTPRRPQAGRPRRIFDRAWPIHDADGRLVFEHVRWRLDPPEPRSKDFSYRYRVGAHKIVWGKPDGADALLYRLPDVLAAKEHGLPIDWTEGERDADAVRSLGAVATSHHGGAGSSTPEQAEWFRGHDGLVNLLMDVDPDDKRGGNPGAYDVMRRWDQLLAVGLQTWQLRIGRALTGKDAADHIAAGHGLADVVWLTNNDRLLLRYKADRTNRGSFWEAGYGDRLRDGWGSRISWAGDAS